MTPKNHIYRSLEHFWSSRYNAAGGVGCQDIIVGHLASDGQGQPACIRHPDTMAPLCVRLPALDDLSIRKNLLNRPASVYTSLRRELMLKHESKMFRL